MAQKPGRQCKAPRLAFYIVQITGWDWSYKVLFALTVAPLVVVLEPEYGSIPELHHVRTQKN
jgi:hypothetical protein